VVPIYFDGHTRSDVQIASHFIKHPAPWWLLIKEFRKRSIRLCALVIGEPIGRNVLEPDGKGRKSYDGFLRKSDVMSCSPEARKNSFDLGFEFEDRHRADRMTVKVLWQLYLFDSGLGRADRVGCRSGAVARRGISYIWLGAPMPHFTRAPMPTTFYNLTGQRPPSRLLMRVAIW